MTLIKTLTALAIAVGLSACGSSQMTSRNLPVEAPIVGLSAPDYAVTALRIAVPTTLRVSEANRFYPLADIVWRGDAFGDRYQQVGAIMREALSLGVAEMDGTQNVVVEVEVTRFHSLTERARYTVGGTHSIKFNLTVRDTDTGEILDGPRLVSADLNALGGTRAVTAERSGVTQKVRIMDHLARVIRRELGGGPTGPQTAAAETAVVLNSPS